METTTRKAIDTLIHNKRVIISALKDEYFFTSITPLGFESKNYHGFYVRNNLVSYTVLTTVGNQREDVIIIRTTKQTNCVVGKSTVLPCKIYDWVLNILNKNMANDNKNMKKYLINLSKGIDNE